MFSFLRRLMTPPKPPMEPLITVLGATGTGKSKLAVDLAVRFNGEIINGDAMQMYKGLPIITNQIPIEERKGVPHHLIGSIEFDQTPWMIGRFQRESLKIIDDIRSRGKVPILVGGTHYYTQSILFHEPLVDEGNADGEPLVDAEDHSSSKSEEFAILNASDEEILQKLKEVDPVMANRWHFKERRKIKRSLEIYLQTGRRASDIYEEQLQKIRESKLLKDSVDSGDGLEATSVPQLGQARFPNVVFWVHGDKETLFERLDGRVERMIDHGLMEEAQTMFKYLHDRESQGLPVDRTRGIWVSIGFKQLEPYINGITSGETKSSEELETLKRECIEEIKSATRQYALQQLRWIKGKLWNALGTAGINDRLYILDSSNVDAWDSVVREPAENITVTFLSGKTCPHPTEITAIANEVFRSKADALASRNDSISQCTPCELCNTVATSDEQWTIHLKGRRHRRALKARQKRAQRDAYFQRLEENSMSDVSSP